MRPNTKGNSRQLPTLSAHSHLLPLKKSTLLAGFSPTAAPLSSESLGCFRPPFTNIRRPLLNLINCHNQYPNAININPTPTHVSTTYPAPIFADSPMSAPSSLTLSSAMLAPTVPRSPLSTRNARAAPERTVLAKRVGRSRRGMRKRARTEVSRERPVRPRPTMRSAVKALRTVLSLSMESWMSEVKPRSRRETSKGPTRREWSRRVEML